MVQCSTALFFVFSPSFPAVRLHATINEGKKGAALTTTADTRQWRKQWSANRLTDLPTNLPTAMEDKANLCRITSTVSRGAMRRKGRSLRTSRTEGGFQKGPCLTSSLSFPSIGLFHRSQAFALSHSSDMRHSICVILHSCPITLRPTPMSTYSSFALRTKLHFVQRECQITYGMFYFAIIVTLLFKFKLVRHAC